MLPLEIFWILTPQSFLFWASESFRQDIGQFHSPRMKPCKSADDFIKVNFYVERKGYDSLRGRCLKGKRFLGARETQGAHKEGGCLYNAKNNSYVVSWQAFPFLFPHIPPPLCTQNPPSLSNACHAGWGYENQWHNHQRETVWYLIKFSQLIFQRNGVIYGDQFREFYNLVFIMA